MERLTKNEHIKNGYICATERHLNEHFHVHQHEFFELELYLSSGGDYIIDGTKYQIEKGLLFFMTPMNFHECEMIHTDFYNVMFTGNICDPSLLARLTNKAPLALKLDEDSQKYFSTLLLELTKHPTDLTFSAAVLNAILAKLVTDIVPTEPLEKRSVINELELYLLHHFRTEITLEEAAKQVRLSPNYLSHLFKKETGRNFKTYLNSLRYEYAEKLLTFSDMTVMEICNECGFHDYPNFVRRFQQHTGLYPMEYRKAKSRS